MLFFSKPSWHQDSWTVVKYTHRSNYSCHCWLGFSVCSSPGCFFCSSLWGFGLYCSECL